MDFRQHYNILSNAFSKFLFAVDQYCVLYKERSLISPRLFFKDFYSSGQSIFIKYCELLPCEVILTFFDEMNNQLFVILKQQQLTFEFSSKLCFSFSLIQQCIQMLYSQKIEPTLPQDLLQQYFSIFSRTLLNFSKLFHKITCTESPFIPIIKRLFRRCFAECGRYFPQLFPIIILQIQTFDSSVLGSALQSYSALVYDSESAAHSLFLLDSISKKCPPEIFYATITQIIVNSHSTEPNYRVYGLINGWNLDLHAKFAISLFQEPENLDAFLDSLPPLSTHNSNFEVQFFNLCVGVSVEQLKCCEILGHFYQSDGSSIYSILSSINVPAHTSRSSVKRKTIERSEKNREQNDFLQYGPFSSISKFLLSYFTFSLTNDLNDTASKIKSSFFSKITFYRKTFFVKLPLLLYRNKKEFFFRHIFETFKNLIVPTNGEFVSSFISHLNTIDEFSSFVPTLMWTIDKLQNSSVFSSKYLSHLFHGFTTEPDFLVYLINRSIKTFQTLFSLAIHTGLVDAYFAIDTLLSNETFCQTFKWSGIESIITMMTELFTSYGLWTASPFLNKFPHLILSLSRTIVSYFSDSNRMNLAESPTSNLDSVNLSSVNLALNSSMNSLNLSQSHLSTLNSLMLNASNSNSNSISNIPLGLGASSSSTFNSSINISSVQSNINVNNVSILNSMPINNISLNSPTGNESHEFSSDNNSQDRKPMNQSSDRIKLKNIFLQIETVAFLLLPSTDSDICEIAISIFDNLVQAVHLSGINIPVDIYQSIVNSCKGRLKYNITNVSLISTLKIISSHSCGSLNAWNASYTFVTNALKSLVPQLIPHLNPQFLEETDPFTEKTIDNDLVINYLSFLLALCPQHNSGIFTLICQFPSLISTHPIIQKICDFLPTVINQVYYIPFINYLYSSIEAAPNDLFTSKYQPSDKNYEKYEQNERTINCCLTLLRDLIRQPLWSNDDIGSEFLTNLTNVIMKKFQGAPTIGLTMCTIGEKIAKDIDIATRTRIAGTLGLWLSNSKTIDSLLLSALTSFIDNIDLSDSGISTLRYLVDVATKHGKEAAPFISAICKKNSRALVENCFDKFIIAPIEERTIFLNALASNENFNQLESHLDLDNGQSNKLTPLLLKNFPLFDIIVAEISYQDAAKAGPSLTNSAISLGMAVEFASHIIELELACASEDTRNTLFRGNGVYATALGQFPRLYGMEWLRKTVGSEIINLVKKANKGYKYQIKQLDLPEDELKDIQKNFRRFLKHLIVCVLSNLLVLPTTLIQICKIIYTKVEEKFKDLGINIINSFLFLRFIFPLISQPSLIGVKETIPEQAHACLVNSSVFFMASILSGSVKVKGKPFQPFEELSKEVQILTQNSIYALIDRDDLIIPLSGSSLQRSLTKTIHKRFPAYVKRDEPTSPQESVSQDSSLIPQDSNLIAQDSNLIPQDSNLIPQDSNLIPQDSNLITQDPNNININQESDPNKQGEMVDKGIDIDEEVMNSIDLEKEDNLLIKILGKQISLLKTKVLDHPNIKDLINKAVTILEKGNPPPEIIPSNDPVNSASKNLRTLLKTDFSKEDMPALQKWFFPNFNSTVFFLINENFPNVQNRFVSLYHIYKTLESRNSNANQNANPSNSSQNTNTNNNSNKFSIVCTFSYFDASKLPPPIQVFNILKGFSEDLFKNLETIYVIQPCVRFCQFILENKTTIALSSVKNFFSKLKFVKTQNDIPSVFDLSSYLPPETIETLGEPEYHVKAIVNGSSAKVEVYRHSLVFYQTITPLSGFVSRQILFSNITKLTPFSSKMFGITEKGSCFFKCV